MKQSRYWVVGGEYRSLAFDEMVEGTQHVLGPFDEYDTAKRSWREISERNRARCNVRYTIAQENA